MSAVADKLDEARALIERGWTQGCAARSANGNPIGFDCARAACWCMVGAMWRSGGEPSDFTPLEDAIGNENIAAWNDAPERTQAEVVEAFRKAAELARAGDA